MFSMMGRAAGKARKPPDGAAPAAGPTKNSGGGGFAFEDKFGAALIASMISGEPPLALGLPVPSRLDFQVASEGWRLDDVLMSFGSARGQVRCACSVKSFDMLRGGKAPADLVRQAWTHILEPSLIADEPFDPEKDLFGMVMAPPSAQGRWDDLQGLITDARDQDSGDLARRSSRGPYSAAKQKLFRSFACPPDLAVKHGVDIETSPGSLLRRLVTLRYDFQDSSSTDEVQALLRCRRALEPGQPLGEQELWEALRAWVAETRSHGGQVSWPRIIERLGGRFRFALRQDVAPDWALLKRAHTAAVAGVPDSLGNQVHLDRARERAKLDEAVADGSIGIALGPSGCGKSALAKAWVKDKPYGLFIPARSLKQGLAAFAKVLGVGTDLSELLRLAPGEVHIVIDGLDRAFDASTFDAAAAILRAARGIGPRVHVIVPCQTAEWARVGQSLAEANAGGTYTQVEIGELDLQDLAQVYKAFPQLRAIATEARLSSALRRPKILDLLIQFRGQIAGISGSTDEAEIARWAWDRLARGTGPNGTSRALLLNDLACHQGDRLQAVTALDELSNGALLASQAEDLRRDGVLHIEDIWARFEHDLFGDWARYAVLRRHDADLAQFLENRVTLPPWHRAIRLHALAKLRESGGPQSWANELRRVAGREHGLVGDLFLEAPLYADDPKAALEALWPRLIADKGVLLNRLLGRFLHVATYPDPSRVALFEGGDPQMEAYAATQGRLPAWPLWLPVLEVLHEHRAEAIEVAKYRVAEVVGLWLQRSGPRWPLRAEAADIALEVGEALVADLLRGVWYQDDADEVIWRNVILAGGERPDDVAALVERALGTAVDETLEDDLDVDFAVDLDNADETGLSGADQTALRKVLLDTDALHPMMGALPEKAAQLLVRGSIGRRRPRRRGLYDGGSGAFRMPGQTTDITDAPRWLAVTPLHGQYRVFLQMAPKEGIDTILQIVDHATSAWATAVVGEAEDAPTIELGLQDKSTWTGDVNVLFWRRGDSDSKVLTAALMALEHWLYARADSADGVDEVVDELLNRSRSLAVLGVLVELACRNPEMLDGPLKVLMTSPDLLVADRNGKLTGGFHGLSAIDPTWGEQALKWHQLEHRSRKLEDLALWKAISTREDDDFFAAVRTMWLSRAEQHDDSWLALDFLAAKFDPANYTAVEDDQGSRFEYKHPPHLKATVEAEALRMRADSFWLQFPMHCQRILDSGSEPLADEALEQLWAETHQCLGDDDVREAEARSIHSLADAECGLAAVVVARGRNWLSQRPDREAWCRDAMVRAVEQPPAPSPHDTDANVVTYRWDVFCARALPLLWAADVTDPELRHAIARLALDRHAVTIARLFASAASVREQLGADFGRLQRLAMEWSKRRMAQRYVDRIARDEPIPVDEALLGSFVSGLLEPELPAGWPEEAYSVPAREPAGCSGRRKPPRPVFAMDLEWFRASLEWLPALDAAHTEGERQQWLRLWTDVARLLGRRLELEEDEEAQLPYEHEIWALRRLARQVLATQNGEEARTLWEPVVQAGPAGGYWVEVLLQEFFSCGLGEDHPRFLVRWREIVDYVDGSERWRRFGRYADRVDSALLGVDDLALRFLWEDRHQPLVESMRACYARWAPSRLINGWLARRFAWFLAKPAAQPLVEDGLLWLRDAAAKRTRSYDDDDLDEAISELLVHVDKHHPGVLRGQTEAGHAARDLLHALAAKQLPIALELVRRLAS